jgi:carbon storage regulator
MLVLSRRIGEQIYIPDYGVAIEVLDIQGSRIRVGITAPSDVPIMRKELRRRVAEDGRRAGQRGCLAVNHRDRIEPPGDGATAPNHDAVNRTAQLIRWIARRTCGRVRSLSVSTDGTRTIVEGSASSYYARQLAQAAAQEFLEAGRDGFAGEVEFQIDVRQPDGVSDPLAASPLRAGEAV